MNKLKILWKENHMVSYDIYIKCIFYIYRNSFRFFKILKPSASRFRFNFKIDFQCDFRLLEPTLCYVILPWPQSCNTLWTVGYTSMYEFYWTVPSITSRSQRDNMQWLKIFQAQSSLSTLNVKSAKPQLWNELAPDNRTTQTHCDSVAIW